ncbi:hypothetical protein E0Z10_g6777 [Xylaria hypoxylon]|uniref:Uncharacterized protein n=1 Tax=Xylaria hypoxylon TaxID=37992 RepID=A0A4Z0YRF4_9PEZI|nr:hypothetical protein E0Z10_g6777 [Xylaria hypoxylon]
MPPHSLCEWMLGQNIHRRPKKKNELRHVVSFEVLTDDESNSDIYKIAMPRGKLAQPSKARIASEPAKSSLKQPSPILSDFETETATDVSDETSGDEETSDEEPDPTCPCKKCIEGRRKLNRMKQAKVKGRKKKSIPVASSSEDKSEDGVTAAIHAQHQAKGKKKKVSFADMSPEESSDASIVKVKSQPKKDKKKSAVSVSVSSEDEGESEDSSVEANVEVRKRKKGSASVAVVLSSGDESESEASVVQANPKAKKGTKMSSILRKASPVLTPESSVSEESDNSTARVKQQVKSKKANTAKLKDSKLQKNTSKDKKKKRDESESGESSIEDTPSETEEDTEETEDTEEEIKAQSSKKGKQKGKNADKKAKTSSKRENEQKATSKKSGKKGEQNKKSVKRHNKSVSEPEPESESESESEVEVPKKVKPKSKIEREKGPKKVTGYPPARSPPYIRQPNMLLPPRTSVMQIEHAVENPGDPRPNAFFDNDSGTTRVYHGPAYGNPYGMLYPKRTYDYQNLPVGVPQPVQNPWYNGFPPVNGQHAAPHVPPQGGAADESNPWFRGWGTVGPAPIAPNMPPPPEFTAPKDKNYQKHYAERYNQSPPRSRGSKDRDAGWDSNVIPIPSVEVTGPNGSPAKDSNHSRGSKAGSASGRPWGAQGVPGSSWSPDKQTEKKKKKKDTSPKISTGIDATFSDTLAGLGKALQNAAAKDSADLRAREERWSNRSSSSKELSPQPNNSWNDTNNNNNNGGGWGDTNNGGGSGWDAGNTNTGGDSAWDNTAANNSWGNGGGNDGRNNVNTNNNNGGWDSNNNNSGWDNNGNNGGPSNTNNNDGWNDNNNTNTGGWGDNNDNSGPNNTNNNNGNNDWANHQSNNDTNNGTTWEPTGPPPSPVSKNATPIPGTWASPVLSNGSNKPPTNWSGGNVGGHASPIENKDTGKGKAVESGSGWGDRTLAQSSGGYWNTKEGQADISKGASNKADNNESWW